MISVDLRAAWVAPQRQTGIQVRFSWLGRSVWIFREGRRRRKNESWNHTIWGVCLGAGYLIILLSMFLLGKRSNGTYVTGLLWGMNPPAHLKLCEHPLNTHLNSSSGSSDLQFIDREIRSCFGYSRNSVPEKFYVRRKKGLKRNMVWEWEKLAIVKYQLLN